MDFVGSINENYMQMNIRLLAHRYTELLVLPQPALARWC